jgi:hypothetical protein
VRGDNEPPILSGATSNVCIFSNEDEILSGATSNVCIFSNEDEDIEDPLERVRNWEKRAFPTPANYVCPHYKERFY